MKAIGCETPVAFALAPGIPGAGKKYVFEIFISEVVNWL
jgi:hypothetical protein